MKLGQGHSRIGLIQFRLGQGLFVFRDHIFFGQQFGVLQFNLGGFDFRLCLQ